MAFKIYRSRRTVSGQAPGARANIDVRTGGQQIAQAVSGLGGDVADLGLRWDNTLFIGVLIFIVYSLIQSLKWAYPVTEVENSAFSLPSP